MDPISFVRILARLHCPSAGQPESKFLFFGMRAAKAQGSGHAGSTMTPCFHALEWSGVMDPDIP